MVFNNYQRAHYNYLEQIIFILLATLISSFQLPSEAGILAIVYSVGRVFYSWGYYHDPNKRLFGALIVDLSLLGLIGTTGYSLYKM